MTLLDVSASPDPGAFPGAQALQAFINGAMFFALAATLLAFIVGAAAWAVGRHGGNLNVSNHGKSAMVAGAFGAFFAGAAAAIINFFFHAGQAVR